MNEESEQFETKDGMKQGCMLSPMFFSAVIDDAMQKTKGKINPDT